MPQQVFKFLDPYEREDRDRFHGREDEVTDLYKMVFDTRLMLVYGLSGTGKSSIVKCGLANAPVNPVGMNSTFVAGIMT